jgi:hypothetical protein
MPVDASPKKDTSQQRNAALIGNAMLHATHDGVTLTENGRRAFLQRFEDQIREKYPDLPEAEIQRRAGWLRRAHMLRLAYRSAKVRRSRKQKQETRETSAAVHATGSPIDGSLKGARDGSRASVREPA